MVTKKEFRLLVLVIFCIFLLLNLVMYLLLTKRLSNNFGNASSVKMIDVENYLPSSPNNHLYHIDSSIKILDNEPVLDGATALLPIYASIASALYPTQSIKYKIDDKVIFLDDSKLKYSNTLGAYDNLANGLADIIFVAKPNDDQRQKLKDKHIKLELVPIGYEAFVFFVNEKNPVNNLSSEDIRKIYKGDIRNWKEVGGSNRVINPITRPSGSGSDTMFKSFMKDTKVGNKSIFALLGASIGFSFKFYLSDIVDNSHVKMISVDGVYPNKDNIASKSYPLVTEFYCAYDKNNPNPNISRIIEWIRSSEGHELISGVGYTSLS